MQTSLVITIVGEDKPGIVEEISGVVLAVGANWEESRMARLAGKFAGILRVTADAARARDLAEALTALQGLTVVVETGAEEPDVQFRTIGLELVGHDRPGIVREISRVLAERGVNIEEFESEITSAPDSGDALFRGRARLRTPPQLAPDALRAALEAVALDLMVDLKLEESLEESGFRNQESGLG
jgi:glycine cleavage system regulatory protein